MKINKLKEVYKNKENIFNLTIQTLEEYSGTEPQRALRGQSSYRLEEEEVGGGRDEESQQGIQFLAGTRHMSTSLKVCM